MLVLAAATMFFLSERRGMVVSPDGYLYYINWGTLLSTVALAVATITLLVLPGRRDTSRPEWVMPSAALLILVALHCWVSDWAMHPEFDEDVQSWAYLINWDWFLYCTLAIAAAAGWIWHETARLVRNGRRTPTVSENSI